MAKPQPQPLERDPFFVVWNPFEQRLPRRTFDTRKEALAYADRKAKQEPGIEFYVMKALLFVCHDPTVEREPKPTREEI